MSDGKLYFTIDGETVEARPGQTIIEAADEAGVYIPRLCHDESVPPGGHCRVCTVQVDGRLVTACTTPAAAGLKVVNESEEVNHLRRALVEMLFMEGNHHCPSCEKSGNCKLQATAYRLGMMGPFDAMLFPVRELDASHPDVYLDRDRCILCGLCVRASKHIDGKTAFGFEDRAIHERLGVDGARGLAESNLAASDAAVAICPTGCLQRKREGFLIPVGRRLYDHRPIGSDIEDKRAVLAGAGEEA